MQNNTKRQKPRTTDTSLKRRILPGLNVQVPWSQLILSGKKTIETRFYPLPRKYIDKEMLIIETPGKKGKFKARIVGIVIFGEPFEYSSKTAFYQDRTKHLVDINSPDFTWESGDGKKKWGWPINSVKKIKAELPKGLRRGIVCTKAIPVREY